MVKKRKQKDRKKLLSDHTRKGKFFLPPLLSKLSTTIKFIHWIDDLLPEIIWIALLLNNLSRKRAIDVALRCAQETKNIVPREKCFSFAIISDYFGIDDITAKNIRESLRENKILYDIQSSIIALTSLYDNCFLNILFDERDKEIHKIDLDKAISTMKKVVMDCFDRRGVEATVAQSIAVYIMGVTGKMMISKNVDMGDLNQIFHYPDTDESQKIASFIRAAISAIVMPGSIKNNSWCQYFWKHGYDISVCEFKKINYEKTYVLSQSLFNDLLEIGQKFKNELYKEVQDHWYQSKIDLSQPFKWEVLAGLIARQSRLTSSIATDYNLWSVDLGRIVLRCIVDTHINLAWLIKNGTEKDYHNFIDYGLGQEKLLLEHLLSRIDESEREYNYLLENIENMRDWINSQIMTDFLPINVGFWTKKNTRELAKESDCIDIYNLSYNPLSSVVHGMWNAIARVNLDFCRNPLHRFHRLPNFEEPPIHFGQIELAVSVMEKSFRVWEKAMGVEPLEITACLRFLENFKDLLETISESF